MKTNMIANSLTIVMTGKLEVKIMASFLWNNMTIKQNESPTAREVNVDTMVANFAPFAFPAPSSFATRTLDQQEAMIFGSYNRIENEKG